MLTDQWSKHPQRTYVRTLVPLSPPVWFVRGHHQRIITRDNPVSRTEEDTHPGGHQPTGVDEWEARQTARHTEPTATLFSPPPPEEARAKVFHGRHPVFTIQAGNGPVDCTNYLAETEARNGMNKTSTLLELTWPALAGGSQWNWASQGDP